MYDPRLHVKHYNRYIFNYLNGGLLFGLVGPLLRGCVGLSLGCLTTATGSGLYFPLYGTIT